MTDGGHRLPSVELRDTGSLVARHEPTEVSSNGKTADEAFFVEIAEDDG